MWIAKHRVETLEAEVEAWAKRYEALRVQANKAVARVRQQAQEADKRCAEMSERLVMLANRPVQVVPPPDTAAIVQQTIEGMATVLNGWKDSPRNEPIVQQPLSFDMQGLDDRAGVPQDLSDFVPPWEEGMPAPTHGGFANGQLGNYTPYIPGQGNTTPPKGGME